MTDSPNIQTETANRTAQSGSLTVPADGYKVFIIFMRQFV
jgi:hypothetical protein